MFKYFNRNREMALLSKLHDLRGNCHYLSGKNKSHLDGVCNLFPDLYEIYWKTEAFGIICQSFTIPQGMLRVKGGELVEPTAFQKGNNETMVLLGNKWWQVSDITLVEGGMDVSYKTPSDVCLRSFQFSDMKWDLNLD